MNDLAKLIRRHRTAVLGLTLVVALAGCGGPKMASVKGTVTFNGQPVTAGTLVFGPVGSLDAKQPGRPATAAVQPDGTFTLGTNSAADGAILGKHRVIYTPPPQDLTEEQRRDPHYIAPPPPFLGLQVKETTVEISAGRNTIDLELIAAE